MARAFVASSSQHLISTTVVDYSGVSIWFNVSDLSVDRPIFSVYQNAASAERHTLYVETTGKLCGFSSHGALNTTVKTTNTVNVNEWHHAWMDAVSTLRVILDGGTAATGTLQSPSGLNRTALARQFGLGSPNYFEGRLCEFACYSDELGAYSNNIPGQLAKGISPLKVYPSLLNLYMPLIHDDRDVIAKTAFTAVNSPTFADHARIWYPGKVA